MKQYQAILYQLTRVSVLGVGDVVDAGRVPGLDVQPRGRRAHGDAEDPAIILTGSCLLRFLSS